MVLMVILKILILLLVVNNAYALTSHYQLHLRRVENDCVEKINTTSDIYAYGLKDAYFPNKTLTTEGYAIVPFIYSVVNIRHKHKYGQCLETSSGIQLKLNLPN
jgi:hypothetical protein